MSYNGSGGKITLPNKLTTIEDSAFWGCTSLQKVSIPSSVKKIGIGAFENCDNLKSVYIPKTVKEIGNYALGFVYYGDYVPVIDFSLMGENNTVAKASIKFYVEYLQTFEALHDILCGGMRFHISKYAELPVAQMNLHIQHLQSVEALRGISRPNYRYHCI